MKKIKYSIPFILLMLAFGMIPQAMARRVTLEAETPVELKLLDSLASNSNGSGQVVNFEVVEDVRSKENDILIKKGTRAKGILTYAGGRADYGAAGQVAFIFKSTKAVDGQKVLLDGSFVTKGKDKNMFWYVFWLGPMANGIKGQDVTINPGKTFEATVDEAIQIELPDGPYDARFQAQP